MTLYEAAFQYLSGVAGVTALFGSGSSCRIYQQEVPEPPTAPFAVWLDDGEEPAHQFGAVPSIAAVSVGIEVYAATTANACQTAQEAIYLALMGAEASITGRTVKEIFCEDRGRVSFEGAPGYYRSESRYRIYHDIP